MLLGYNSLLSSLYPLVMKRKLDEDDIPAPVLPQAANYDADPFSSFGLDSRLQQAVVKEGFSIPTPVQKKAIPLCLDGKDILGRW